MTQEDLFSDSHPTPATRRPDSAVIGVRLGPAEHRVVLELFAEAQAAARSTGAVVTLSGLVRALLVRYLVQLGRLPADVAPGPLAATGAAPTLPAPPPSLEEATRDRLESALLSGRKMTGIARRIGVNHGRIVEFRRGMALPAATLQALADELAGS